MEFSVAPGVKSSATPISLSFGMSASGMMPPPKTTTSPRPRSREQLEHPGEQRHVRAGEQRQADGVGVLLEDGLGDLLRRLVQAGVDDLEAAVAQRPGDDLRAPIVTVEAGLRDDDSVPALHAGRNDSHEAAEFGRLDAPSRLDSPRCRREHCGVPPPVRRSAARTSSCSSAPARRPARRGRDRGGDPGDHRTGQGPEHQAAAPVRARGRHPRPGAHGRTGQHRRPERRRRLLGRDRGPPARRAAREAAEAAELHAALARLEGHLHLRRQAGREPQHGPLPELHGAAAAPTRASFMVALRDVEPAPDGPPGTGG